MPNLLFSIHDLLSRRERKNQTRVALQLLALSGVVRPSHVELRYPTTVITGMGLYAQCSTSQHSLTHPFPRRSWASTITSHLKQTGQWVNNLGRIPRERRKVVRHGGRIVTV